MARIGTAYISIEGDFSPLRRQLATLQGGRSDISVEVKAKVDQASFANAKRKGGTLGGTEEVKLKADVDVSSFARAKAVVSAFSHETEGMSAFLDRSRLSYGQLTTAFTAGLPFIVDVTAALGALTASAAAAGAGLGALAAGGVGAASVGFGGIAAIAAPAIKSLGDLMTAQQAHNKAVTTGGASAARTAASNAQQIKTATEGVTTAENQLKVAQEGETVAQKALTLARQAAVRELQDMRRAAIEGGTSEKRAQLSIKQAQENLQTVRSASTSTSLDIRDAELSVVEARQNARDVAIDAGRAEDDYNKAKRKGINQMPGVISAQQSLTSATRGVADAQKAVARATQNLAFQQKQTNMAAEAGATSLAALRLAQKKAGPEAVKFAKNLKEMGHRWKDLTKEGKTDFFGLLNDGLTRANERLPMFAKSANRSMAALRDGLDQFWQKAADGPGFDKFIGVMTRTFENSMVPLGDAFGNVAKVLERISVAVAPDLVRLFKGFDEMTQGWVDSTRNAGDLRETIHGLVNQTNAWWKLIKAASGLIVAVLVPGMGQGKQAVEGITASLKEWTAWVNAHPREMRDFFKEGLETTKELFEVISGFVPALFQLSRATRPIARAFLAILKGLNSLKIGNVSALTGLLGAMLGFKVARGLVGMVELVSKLKTAWLGVRGAAIAAGGAEAAATAVGAGGIATGAGAAVAGGTAGGVAIRGATAGGVLLPAGVEGAVAGSAGASGAATAAGIGLGTVLGAGIVAGVGALLAKKLGDELEIQTDKAGSVAFKGGPPAGGGPLLKDSPFAINWTPPHPDFLDPFLGATKEADNKIGDLVDHMRKKFGTLADAPVGALDRLRKRLDDLQTSGEDTGGAFRNFTRRMREEFGSLVTAGAHMSQKQRDVYKQMAVAARQNGDITAKQFQRIENAMTDSVQKQKKSLRDAARATGVSMSQIRKFVGDMTVTVSKDYDGMVRVTGHGMELLTSNTNEALRALGIKKSIKFTIAHGGHGTSTTSLGAHGHHLQGQQRGGMIDGQGDGDKVHIMAEPGEGFINKKAVQKMGGPKVIDAINRRFPRFRQGGVVDRTGVQHFAKGGMVAMTAEAQKFEQRHFPYVWGGGHGGFGIQPVDCSGAVSDVLHAAGLLSAPMVSGALANWGKPGKGPLTVFANPEHTFMSLAGRYFGTSSSNPGGGAGWIEGGFPGSYLSQFAARTMDVVGGMAGKLKRVLLKGPKGPLKDMGQGALDKTWKAANAYLAKQAPAGAFGGGQGLADFGKGPGKVVGASVYGFGEPGTGTVGASGVSLPGKPAFAELDMGTALGGLPFGKKLGIEVGGKKAVGVKLDIGAGGGDVQGHHRSIDFWSDLAKQLGIGGTFLGLAKVSGLQKGGLVKVPSFAGGGTVPGPRGKPQLVEAHGGERITPPSREGKRYALTITNWDEGTGYMREIADDSVDGTASLNNQLSRMHR